MTFKDFLQTDFSLAAVSAGVAVVSGKSAEQITTETIHWFFIALGAVTIFVLNKIMNYFWDKYIEKKHENGKHN